jgi:hypothetical protein
VQRLVDREGGGRHQDGMGWAKDSSV